MFVLSVRLSVSVCLVHLSVHPSVCVVNVCIFVNDYTVMLLAQAQPDFRLRKNENHYMINQLPWSTVTFLAAPEFSTNYKI